MKWVSYNSEEKFVPAESTNNSTESDPCDMDSSVCTDSQPNPDDSRKEILSGRDSTIQTAHSIDDLSERNSPSDGRTSHIKRITGSNNVTKNSNETFKDTSTNVTDSDEDFYSTTELPGEVGQKKYTFKTLTPDTAHLPKYNRKHKKLETLTCEHCKETFKGYARLILHMNEKHSVPFKVSMYTMNCNHLF